MTGVSRRQILQSLTVGTFALAGCTATQNDGGTESPTTTATPTTTSTDTTTSTETPVATWTGPEYGLWLPAPGTIVPGPPYKFWVLDLTEFADHQGSLPPSTQNAIDAAWGPLELDWRTVPLVVMFRGNHVIKADFDRAAVVDQISGTDGWTETGRHEGYTVVAQQNGARAFAVGDAAIVTARGYGEDRPGQDTATGIVDTRQGFNRRYPGDHDAVADLIDAFGDGFLRHWRPRETFENTPQEEAEFDGQVGLGRRGRYVEGSTAAVQQFYVFETADVVDVDAVRSYVDEHSDEGEQFAPWEGLEIRQDGRMVVLEGRLTRRPQS